MTPRMVARKVAGALGTLLFVVVFNFFLFRIVPTDPISTLFRGRNLTLAQRAQLTQRFGLNGSTTEQFVRYLGQTARGNFGISYENSRPVMENILGRLWPTVTLVGISTLLSAAIGLWIGIRSAWRRGSTFDVIGTSVSMTTYAMPDFFLGILLLVMFGSGLGWFPTGGIIDPSSTHHGLLKLLEQAHHMVLPCMTLTLAYMGEYTLVMRSSLLDVMSEDYLTLARAKGLRDDLVRRRHAVPNALLPTTTLVALNLGFVLSGAIAVETVFSWPGLGLAVSQAIRGPDFPMLQGLFLVFSSAIVVANLAADLLYTRLDPRVRVA
jgi:peptide/nickel transport system permease protein